MPALSLYDILALLHDYTLIQVPDDSIVCDHIAIDSRKSTSSSIFVALCGVHLDAREFIATCKASCILVDQWSNEWTEKANTWHKTIIKVQNARKDMAIIASALCDYPAQKMKMIGVTGTNGKTTTTWMLSHILMYCGRHQNPPVQIGTIGTIGPHINGVPLPNPDGFTTPESPALQRTLQQFATRGCDACIMEVSSIGLMMQRVGNIQFDVAAFTNFTQDHLDIHPSMDAYLQEKRKLFTHHVHAESVSILVADQPETSKTPVSHGHTLRLSTTDTFSHGSCDAWVKNAMFSIEGSTFTFLFPDEDTTQEVYVPLIGKHNIENAIVAVTTAMMLGYTAATIAKAFHSLPQVPGRMERISSAAGWHAFVDYAHTPDALEQSLCSLKQLCTGRLWVLFGCGGDRDRQKRPQMGALAYEHADGVWITSDNPRSESPTQIINDILAGLPTKCQKPVQHIVDRRVAIETATQFLNVGDVLLIAGKGHETYQIIDGVKHHFDDCEEIRKYC